VILVQNSIVLFCDQILGEKTSIIFLVQNWKWFLFLLTETEGLHNRTNTLKIRNTQKNVITEITEQNLPSEQEFQSTDCLLHLHGWPTLEKGIISVQQYYR
jgi:hypothetical protein